MVSTILDSVWFSTMQTPKIVGIVLVNNGYENKAYIGVGEGVSKEVDELIISKLGGIFPLEIARQLIK